MNVLSYPPILDAISLVNLKKEVQYFYPLGYNKWIGKYDEPENTVERYILDSFDFLLSSQYPTAVGFEWWIENLDGHNTITLHSNHDDHHRKENRLLQYPLLSTETYLTNDMDPTTILNTKQGKYWGEYENNPPTEAVFSAPQEGKFVTSDPRYMRGVFGGCSSRITLCYDVWDYKPKNLNRVGIVTKPFDVRFYKEESSLPVQWLGKTKKMKLNIAEQTFFKKFPTGYNAGETWKVTQ